MDHPVKHRFIGPIHVFVESIEILYDFGMLDLIRLRVLVAVAQEGSVTAAADSLGYAQPSISHHLRQLESEVGVPLFQRAGRGLRLTDAGAVLVRRATEILGHVDAAVAEVETYAGLRAGRVRLAAFPSALASLIPQAMAAFTSQYPDVSISLVDAEPPKALAMLRNNDVDVAVVFAHADTPDVGLKHVTLTTLLDDPLYLITSARNADAANEITDYAGETWIAGCRKLPRPPSHRLQSSWVRSTDRVRDRRLRRGPSAGRLRKRSQHPSRPRSPCTSEPGYPRTPHSRRATHCLRRNLRETSARSCH